MDEKRRPFRRSCLLWAIIVFAILLALPLWIGYQVQITYFGPALHRVARAGDLPAIRRCLWLGYDINDRALGRMIQGRTPLYVAAESRRREAVELLLARGADPNLPDVKGWTPLHTAVVNGADPAILQALLDHHADPTLRDRSGRTPLSLAREAGNQEAAALLRRYRAR